MARSGAFGKLPKAAPDLSSTIAQLLAQYAADVDQNMVDAWKNGGEVDGKPVTDARLLAHFKSRMNDLDPKSPEYQQWKNRITQYEFSIEESKMTVKWDNRQASESDMAAFYHKWEQKTPDNTEFDRSLRKSYGQWMRSASARSAGDAAKAKAEAHNRWATGLYNKDVKAAHTANTWLASMLYKWGPLADSGTGGQQPGPPSNIGGLEASGFGDFETLITLMQNGGAGLTPDQKADVDAFTAGMKKIDPTFNWSSQWFIASGTKASTALKTLTDKSTTKEEANQWSNINTDTKITINRIKSAPGIEDAKAAREELETALKTSAGNPDLQRAALQTYLAKITKVRDTINKAGSFMTPNTVDDTAISGINSDINVITAGLNGQKITGKVEPSWLDTIGGTNAQTGQDSQSWVGLLNGMNDNAAKIAAGGWAEVGKDKEGNTVFAYHGPEEKTPAGMEVVTGYHGAGGNIPVLAAPVPVEITEVGASGYQTGAKPIKTNSQGQPVKQDGSVATDPKDYVEGSDVGFYSVTLPDPSGHDVTYFKTVMDNGAAVYTLDPPLNPNAKAEAHSDGKGGMIVTVKTNDPNAAQKGFSVRDMMQWGPQTTGSGPNTSTTGGKTDTIRPPSPWVDAAGQAVTDPSKAVASIAGTYLTPDGVKWAGMLDALSVSDPNYLAQRKAILDTAQQAAVTAANQSFRAGERGDAGLSNSLGTVANAASSDFNNLMVLATAQANGDTSSKGQWAMADLLRNSKAVWNGNAVVSTVDPGAVGAATSADNMNKAREWAKQQLSMYDGQWSQLLPGKDVDPKALAAAQAKYGSGPFTLTPRASEVVGGYDPQYGNLRNQIETAQDPRLLKLPSFVTGQANPYLAGQSGQQVTLPTTPGGTGAPGVPGAPTTTVAPPTNVIPQPPAPKVGPTMPQVTPPVVAAPTPPPLQTVAAGGKYGSKPIPI